MTAHGMRKPWKNKAFLNQLTILCTDCGILRGTTTAPFQIEKHGKPEEIWCVSPGVVPPPQDPPCVERAFKQ